MTAQSTPREFSDPAVAEKILRSYRKFAVVGCSADPRRPSHGVARFLMHTGYDVVCVNPKEVMCIEGLPCYPDLASVEGDVEVVDIFRRSDQAGRHVDEAIEIGAKAVWMQLGVIDSAAARRADAAGLDVVMDRCPAIDYPRLIGDPQATKVARTDITLRWCSEAGDCGRPAKSL